MEKFESLKFQRQLLNWYRKNARALPWRRTKDPYKIWVSEAMLQQTQVKTVIPYYEKWMERFPSLQALARAPLAEVLKYWAGLGYYRRARMLHQGAKDLCKKNPKAILPDSVEELRKIPGIGKYTAGAIASIAFNRKAPILDGNVIRVISRLRAFEKDIGSIQAIQELWRLAESLLPEKNPGDFNQALMELGATICLPKNPRCPKCPISNLCVSLQEGSVLKYPVKKQKESLKKLRTAALILRNNGKVLIRRQPREGRWGGLWMFPFWENEGIRKIFGHCEPAQIPLLHNCSSEKLAGEPEAKQSGNKRDCFVAKAAPRNDNVLRHRMTVHHGFTKYRVRLEVYECNLETGLSSSPWFIKGEAGWGKAGTSQETPPNLPFSATQKADPRLPSGGQASSGGHKQRGGTVKQMAEPLTARWIKISELPKLAFPSPHQKIVDDLIKNG